MLIGILQTGEAPANLAPTSGDYPDMFQQLLADQGFTFRTWRVLDNQFPASVTECDGWLLTGSRFGAYEDHPFIPPLEAFIREAYAAAIPMVGICFGHQIIAQALGGKVEKFSKGWSVGPTDYDFNGETLRLNAWHQDQVTRRPETATVAACSDFCENAALVYGDRIFTVQAHPEFQSDFVDGLMATRGKGVVPDALMEAARARLDQPVDAPILARRIADFFKAPRS
ncbi:MAG: type 1 glutamine amidotransferase [Gemmobacter sp.]|uniref:type 1 glutamine amidotransferase n=1 Tax=Gemmobacter sp. TaxID=1898957 RepID=UPI001A48E868|nr:type 1 glutamine amidotransferase [Gemmobacter sp.]MBL8561222.1 type 1 glutamine amidotransferase [Gemmobacter sp.]